MNKDLRIELNDGELEALSYEIRKSVFEICLNAKSGHIGGCSGAIELLTVLYFGGFLCYDRGTLNSSNDLILIRGHLGPLRYKIFSLLGYIKEESLSNYRKFKSGLPGHEDHFETKGVDISPSGSLGMILSYGVGCAYVAKYKKEKYITFVFLGDGEEQEGNISEAARHAAHMHLNNLVVIIDKNSKQLSNPVAEIDSSDLSMIWSGYGWRVIELENGHNIFDIKNVYNKAIKNQKDDNRPLLIIANTVKGFGLDGCENHFSGYHTVSTCDNDVVKLGIDNLSKKVKLVYDNLLSAKKKILLHKEKIISARDKTNKTFLPKQIDINPKEKTPENPDFCQLDYFNIFSDDVLNRVIDIKPMFFLTPDVTRKDHVKQLALNNFCSFINVGVREQHLIAMAHGISLAMPDSRIILNTFDAFTYRLMDQLNAAVIGKSSFIIIGDISGLTNSKNGKTHQTSGQPGALLMMPGITFLEPWDAKDTFSCLNWAIGKSRGIIFIRVYSYNTVKISQSIERNINWYIVHESKMEPDITIVASGLTVGIAIQAAQILEKEEIMIRVINIINHGSLDIKFVESIQDKKPLLAIYNGKADVLKMNVAKVLLEHNLNMPSKFLGLGFDMGDTGSTEDLLQYNGLDVNSVINIIKKKLI